MNGWTIPDASTLLGVPLAAIGLGAAALFFAWLSSLRTELEMERLNTAARMQGEAPSADVDGMDETVTSGTPFEDLTRRGFLRPVGPRQSRPSPIVGEFMAYMRLRGELERFAEGRDTGAEWYSPTTIPHGQRRAG